mmetsp:Transcript_21178/g.59611  ORF Transcript_21178/g.59611 Transcript_21178/m.59611 type:complete len:176 (+) Transcript_21178:1-528(+)
MEAQAAELGALLGQLEQVNAALGGKVSIGDTRAHTLARHRDILGDYQQEFKRLQALHGAAADRAELLRGAEGSPLLAAQAGGSSNALLRERSSIQSASNALDQVLGQAQNVASTLSGQRRLFDNMGNKLATVGAKFPVVNGLLTSIRRRKSKDTIILSAVIGICTLFLLIYWARK